MEVFHCVQEEEICGLSVDNIHLILVHECCAYAEDFSPTEVTRFLRVGFVVDDIGATNGAHGSGVKVERIV